MSKKKKKKNKKPDPSAISTYEKVCPSCGKIFRSDNSNSKYCTEECYLKAQNDLHKATKVVSKAPADNSWRNENRYCAYCGKVFIPKAKEQKYCSFKCSEVQRKIDERKKQQAELKKQSEVQHEIAKHNLDFNASSHKVKDEQQMGIEIRKDTSEAKGTSFEMSSTAIYTKKCEYCGTTFKTEGPATKYCSDYCKQCAKRSREEQKLIEKRLKAKKQGEVFYKKTCPVCGDTFETKNVNKIYCSKSCQRKKNVSIKDTSQFLMEEPIVIKKDESVYDKQKRITSGDSSSMSISEPYVTKPVKKDEQQEASALPLKATQRSNPATDSAEDSTKICKNRQVEDDSSLFCKLTKRKVTSEMCTSSCTFFEEISDKERLSLLERQNAELRKRILELEEKLA